MSAPFTVNIQDHAEEDPDKGSLVESRDFTDETEADTWGRAQQARYAGRPDMSATLITWEDNLPTDELLWSTDENGESPTS